MKKILVAYQSKHNSTAEIARTIGDVLSRNIGFKVDVLTVADVFDISGYDAVVLGSAVYAGNWQSEAVEFLKTYDRELAKLPVWLFSSGPTGEGNPTELMKGFTLPEALKPIAERIQPRDVAFFHGKIDPNDLNFFEKGIVKIVKAPVGDFRDWTMIRAWANKIAATLAAEMVTPK